MDERTRLPRTLVAVPTVVALLVVAAAAPVAARAALPDQYAVSAGGTAGVSADGGTSQTAGEKLTASGTLSSRPAVGTAPYTLGAGPGVARSTLSGSWTNPLLLTFSFTPTTSVSARTALIVTGPPGPVSASLNLRVAGKVLFDCPASLNCQTRVAVDANVPGQLLRTEVGVNLASTSNDLGLTVTPITGGLELAGTVTTTPFTVQANTPFEVTLTLRLGVFLGGKSLLATASWQHDFETSGGGLSFATSGPDRAPVLVDWRAVDPEPSSGVPSDPADTLAAVEGAELVFESEPSCDPAGNCATGRLVLSIDMTPPTLSCQEPAPVFVAGGEVGLVSALAADELSGVALVSLGAADTSSVGEKTAEVSALDNAGNETTRACPYRVEYVFDGFAAPVENAPTFTVVRAGRAVPLKWRLTDASGAPVSDLSDVSVTAVSRSCEAGTTGDEIAEEAAGASGLQYLGDGWYQLNWLTPRSYAGSCKTLRLDLGEGAFRTVLFEFRP